MATPMLVYRLNEATCTPWVEEQARKWVRAALGQQSHIGTQALQSLSPVAQVNQFVTLQVLQAWRQRASELVHPYFDFQAPAVRQAMEQLKTVLAQHVALAEADAFKLTKQALWLSLRLLAQPMPTLQQILLAGQPQTSLPAFETAANYFSYFDFIAVSMAGYAQKNGLAQVSSSLLEEKSQRILELYAERTGESIDAYRERLCQELTGQPLSHWIMQEGARSSAPTAAASPSPAPAPPPAPAATQPAPKPEAPPSRPAPEEPAEPSPEPPTPVPTLAEPPAATPPQAPPPSPATTEPPRRVADGYQQEPSRNDAIMDQQIRLERIPLHKQFRFIQRVFAGNKMLFKDTVDALNTHSSWEEAEQYLKTRILNRPEVDREDEAVAEFIALAKSRF